MSFSITLGELAEIIDAKLVGNADTRVNNIVDLNEAGPNGVSFISNAKFASQLSSTSAAAIILTEDLVDACPVAALVVKDPYLSYAKTAQLLDTTPCLVDGISVRASVDESVELGSNVAIAANSVIAKDVVIGDDVQIGPCTSIGEGSIIGDGTIIKANVSIYHGINIGKRALIHSGTVIGSDGFGFANEAGCWIKIPQLGGVTIGDDVEIGASCTIDRGALKNTQIGNGVKFDNMIHIAHNVIIGDHCAMAACVGIAGSTTIGERCTFSGGVSVVGHLNIPAGTHFTVRTVVNKSPLQAGAYSSGTGMQENKLWRKSVARFKQIDEMSRKIKQLEKLIKTISE